MLRVFTIFQALLLLSCNGPAIQQKEDVLSKEWQTIAAESKGQEITFMMWQGDPLINAYVRDFVKPNVKQQLGIDMNIVSGQGNEIVSTLMAELEAGKEKSEVDMVWINGETFFQLRQINTLFGPFVDKLPNSQYINWENPFIHTDFQQPVDGYECPWGNVQMGLIYDKARLENPPKTTEELEAFVKANPGKFTIGNDFTGMTLLKSLLIHFAGGKDSLDGPFDAAKYEKYSQQLWEYINRLKPYFWNQGKSFPATIAQMHQLFSNGELLITMSNNDSEVDNKISQGLFPETARAYVPDFGTIKNSHYLGIVKHSARKEAAMTAINYMISPEAQWKKMHPDVWGDATILSKEKLPAEWAQKFDSIPGRKYAPDRSLIREKALMEPAPEYMIRLFEDFRNKVING